MTHDPELGEVIVEFVRNGPYVKCSAIHVATGREVSAMGPVNEPKSVERVALAKLKRALTQM
ncbi:Uncharacterised protein [Brevundimonas diminuta]|jgi:hypothetical protein|uniref:DUF6898 family protein n=1 Tax=Brevundimonas TaxID=41275 RepID=UPI000207EC08|nr:MULTISPECIES: hypothetical protein [Brevundimonas]OJU48333.1 MAG: hypothetical protein BGO02_07060 [Brevundimonas sp. 67-6]EGF94341.1 hypothetical protein BDIM_11610 [Brevundimonas diminuta ATCC 11568]OMG59868.1 hypothetical protein BJP32_05050 [Brevundimonas sp. ZS04]OWR17534.1 hypothetical protein CD944_13375 [Brevundimonas diminuta]WQE43683.1 hypothetical protein U0020_08655 [Brevundimonas diminuta]